MCSFILQGSSPAEHTDKALVVLQKTFECSVDWTLHACVSGWQASIFFKWLFTKCVC